MSQMQARESTTAVKAQPRPRLDLGVSPSPCIDGSIAWDVRVPTPASQPGRKLYTCPDGVLASAPIRDDLPSWEITQGPCNVTLPRGQNTKAQSQSIPSLLVRGVAPAGLLACPAARPTKSLAGELLLYGAARDSSCSHRVSRSSLSGQWSTAGLPTASRNQGGRHLGAGLVQRRQGEATNQLCRRAPITAHRQSCRPP